VALLLYSYSLGILSSRGIGKACRVDVAYKVITAMAVPDHSRIAEFRRRHELALGEVFVQVLGLCREAGLVSVGVIAIDGTKVKANASRDQNRSYVSIVSEILAEAEQTDREEDERHGGDRGDELPERFRSRESRRAALEEAKRRLEAQRAEEQEDGIGDPVELGFELDLERLGDRRGGRRGWLRNGRRQLEEHRERDSRPVPRSRTERLEDAKQRFEQQLAVETATNAAYERYRVDGRDTEGRRLGARPKPVVTPVLPEGTVNLTDPDSRVMRTQGQPTVQGYNAQAAVTAEQIIVAAEITTESPDFGHLEPVFNAALRDLALVSPSVPRSCSRTPATGTRSRWRASSPAAPACWSRPTQTSERAHALGGPAAAMTSCVACSAATTAASSTASENRRSSRSSVTPSTTAGSGSSADEAEPPHGRNGA